MPNLLSPESSGIAPIFSKTITYSRKKDEFSKIKETFDSEKNIFIFFTFIHYFKDDIINEMNFSPAPPPPPPHEVTKECKENSDSKKE